MYGTWVTGGLVKMKIVVCHNVHNVHLDLVTARSLSRTCAHTRTRSTRAQMHTQVRDRSQTVRFCGLCVKEVGGGKKKRL